MLHLQGLYYVACAIGAAVINYKYMKPASQRQHLCDDLFNIFFFVVGWYDYKLIQCRGKIISVKTKK